MNTFIGSNCDQLFTLPLGPDLFLIVIMYFSLADTGYRVCFGLGSGLISLKSILSVNKSIDNVLIF